MAPRAAQEGPKSGTTNRKKCFPRQEAPRMPQEAPKETQEAPKRAKRGPKTGKGLQTVPAGSQEASHEIPTNTQEASPQQPPHRGGRVPLALHTSPSPWLLPSLPPSSASTPPPISPPPAPLLLLLFLPRRPHARHAGGDNGDSEGGLPRWDESKKTKTNEEK